MPIAQTGDTVHWADGTKTPFTLLGDLQTARFPNTDESTTDPATGQKHPGFFDWFGGPVWSQAPADGKPGIRQSLIVDSETISSNVGRLLELMRDGIDFNGKPVAPPLNEWGVPPGVITPLMAHAAAATRFESGWVASDIRKKYMPGSVASDPQPKPEPDKPTAPGTNQEAEELRKKLADALGRLEAEKQARASLKKGVESVLNVMETGSKKPFVSAVPDEGGGRYANALRHHKKALQALLAVLLLAVLPILSGCASMLPGNQQGEFDGVKTAEPVSFTAKLDPRLNILGDILTLVGQVDQDPLGVVLPLTPVGEAIGSPPRMVVCAPGAMTKKCLAIPMLTECHVVGEPAGPMGVFFRATRIRCRNFDD